MVLVLELEQVLDQEKVLFLHLYTLEVLSYEEEVF